MADLETVRRLAAALPEVTERPSYGTPGFRVADRLFARARDEDAVLVAWTDSVEDRDALIAAEPNVFFTTPHYDGHPSVLVRLAAIGEDELREVLTDAWLARAPKRLRASLEDGGSA